MAYDSAQRQDADYYDGYGDYDNDPRTYHHTPFDGYSADTYDPATYLLTSRRFPDGHLVHRYYSLPDCACQVVQLILPHTTALELAYAMPSELTAI